MTPPDRPKKRFGILSALARFAVALLVVGFAAYQVMGWIASRPEAPQRINRERTFTVNAVTPVYGTHGADITTFGQVVAAPARSICAPRFRAGSSRFPRFLAGRRSRRAEIVVRIDPFAYDAAVIEAQAAIANAELSLAEAREARALENATSPPPGHRWLPPKPISSAPGPACLGRGDPADGRYPRPHRRRTPAGAQPARSQSFTLDAQIQRQRAAIAQARHTLEVAERNRANTEITAPFDATVTASAVTEGTMSRQ